jgi:hypothetical protein
VSAKLKVLTFHHQRPWRPISFYERGLCADAKRQTPRELKGGCQLFAFPDLDPVKLRERIQNAMRRVKSPKSKRVS